MDEDANEARDAEGSGAAADFADEADKADEADEADEGNVELLALHRIDETCTRLQQQGNYLEALECMERGLVLRQHFFGAASAEVWAACKTVGEMCNLLAMTYLQQEDFAMVLELLKKAEILTERDDHGRAVTYNNLACFYRRKGKLHAALTYLQKALKVEQRLKVVENRADTHLNLCAVLSQLGRHAGALEHAQAALILLQEELFPGPLHAGGGDAAGDAKGERAPASVDRIAVLAIAYHNIGVEQEFLKRFEMALESYRKGVDISEGHLGGTHGITVTLRNSYLAAKQAVAATSRNRGQAGGAGGGAGGGGARGQERTRNSHRKAGSRRSPAGKAAKDEQRWQNIQKAYGDVVQGIKPDPVVSPKFNLQGRVEAEGAAVAPATSDVGVPDLPVVIESVAKEKEKAKAKAKVKEEEAPAVVVPVVATAAATVASSRKEDVLGLITPREDVLKKTTAEEVGREQDTDVAEAEENTDVAKEGGVEDVESVEDVKTASESKQKEEEAKEGGEEENGEAEDEAEGEAEASEGADATAEDEGGAQETEKAGEQEEGEDFASAPSSDRLLDSHDQGEYKDAKEGESVKESKETETEGKEVEEAKRAEVS